MKSFLQKKYILPIILIFIFGLWGIRNLFGGVFYTNHDGYTHTARIFQYVTALKDGQFPPRWAGTLNSGLGSPIFVYSYPLPYVFSGFIHAIGFSFVDAFKVTVALGYLLSGIFMFFFLKEFFNRTGAFVGSVFYVLAPYRFLNIYVRGSLSESFAYTAVPLVFFAFVKLWKTKESRWIVFSSLALSFLLLSQYLVAAIFLPVLIGIILLLFLQKHSGIFLRNSAIAFLLGFGLSSFMLTPVFFERQFIKFSESISYYATHFVKPFQLIRSPWGYGFSLPGTEDGMSFQIGLAHLLLIGVSLYFFVLFLMKKQKRTEKRKLRFGLLLFSYILFLITVFLMIDTQVTKYVWRVMPLLTTIDFPWRFLGLTVFSASIIASYVAQNIRQKIFIVGLLLLLLYANRNHIRVNQHVIYSNEEFVSYKGTATWVNEYTPVWRSTTSFLEYSERFSIVEGEIDARVAQSSSKKLTLETSSQTGGIIRLNILYFPGWEIILDDTKLVKNNGYFLTTVNDNTEIDRDDSGLIAIAVPKGQHVIVAQFTETPLRRAGNGISLISLATLPFIPKVINGKGDRRKKIKKSK